MAAVLERIRIDQPHGPYQLAVGMETLAYQPDRYRVQFEGDFADAAADLARQRGRVDLITLDSVGGAPVRNLESYGRFDVTTMLLVHFTAVGFNADSSRAVVFASLQCGLQCGSIAVAVLRRAPEGWLVANYRELMRR